MLEKKEQWEVRRRELYKLAVEMQYGTQPPAPEFMKIQTLCCNEEMKMDSYRIIAGRDNNSLSLRWWFLNQRVMINILRLVEEIYVGDTFMPPNLLTALQTEALCLLV